MTGARNPNCTELSDVILCMGCKCVYNDGERLPIFLQCAHTVCKQCAQVSQVKSSIHQLCQYVAFVITICVFHFTVTCVIYSAVNTTQQRQEFIIIKMC